MNDMAGPRVFLSASVPLPSRNPAYFKTANIIAIRDAVRALTLVVSEKHIKLVIASEIT